MRDRRGIHRRPQHITMDRIRDTIEAYETAERAAGKSPNTIRARGCYLRRWAVLQSDRVDLDATAAFLGTPGSRSRRIRRIRSPQPNVGTAAGAVRVWLLVIVRFYAHLCNTPRHTEEVCTE